FSFEKDPKKRDRIYDVKKTYDTITASDLKRLLSTVEKIRNDGGIRMNELEAAAEYFQDNPSHMKESWLNANQSQIRSDFDVCLRSPRENDKTYQDLLRSVTTEFARVSLRNSRKVTNDEKIKPFID